MDAVNSYLTLAMELDREEIWGQAFNFGPESPISVSALVNKMIEISGKTHLTPKILGEGKPEGEIYHQYLSNRKAMEMLGWRLSYTLEDGLKETIKWYEEFFRSQES